MLFNREHGSSRFEKGAGLSLALLAFGAACRGSPSVTGGAEAVASAEQQGTMRGGSLARCDVVGESGSRTERDELQEIREALFVASDGKMPLIDQRVLQAVVFDRHASAARDAIVAKDFDLAKREIAACLRIARDPAAKPHAVVAGLVVDFINCHRATGSVVEIESMCRDLLADARQRTHVRQVALCGLGMAMLQRREVALPLVEFTIRLSFAAAHDDKQGERDELVHKWHGEMVRSAQRVTKGHGGGLVDWPALRQLLLEIEPGGRLMEEVLGWLCRDLTRRPGNGSLLALIHEETKVRGSFASAYDRARGMSLLVDAVLSSWSNEGEGLRQVFPESESKRLAGLLEGEMLDEPGVGTRRMLALSAARLLAYGGDKVRSIPLLDEAIRIDRSGQFDTSRLEGIRAGWLGESRSGVDDTGSPK